MKKFQTLKNKITIMLLVFLGILFASTQNKAYATVKVPDLPINNIYDSTNYLTDSTKEMLQEYNQEHDTKIAIYMVGSLENESIEAVSKEIAKKWNIGEETRTDSILIIFAIGTKELRFSLSNNLSTPLSIFKLNKVYNSNKQYLDENDYDNAIFNIVKSFEDELKSNSKEVLKNPSQTYSIKQDTKKFSKFFLLSLYDVIPFLFGLLIIVFVSVLLFGLVILLFWFWIELILQFLLS